MAKESSQLNLRCHARFLSNGSKISKKTSVKNGVHKSFPYREHLKVFYPHNPGQRDHKQFILFKNIKYFFQNFHRNERQTLGGFWHSTLSDTYLRLAFLSLPAVSLLINSIRLGLIRMIRKLN